MRKFLSVLTMTICSLGIARASGRADDQQSQQTEMQQSVAGSQMTKDDCSAKAKRAKKQHSQKRQVRSKDQEETPAPQNVIEYGGGG